METTNQNIRKNSKHRSTFAVMFYINKTKIRKDGLCQLLCRITIDTGIAQVGTKVMVDPSVWDGKAGRAAGRSRNALAVNQAIDRLTGKIDEHYRQIQKALGFVSAELVKNALRGIGQKAHTLMKLFEEHNEEYQKRIGVDRVAGSFEHYQRTYALLQLFLREKYDTDDVTLRSLHLSFIDTFDLWLRSERQLAPHTISGHLINLKKISRRAVSQGTLKRDPFAVFIPEQPKRKCRHLTPDEIDRLMTLRIDKKNVRHTRDMFIFSCFTGLAYADLHNLSEEHLRTEADGSQWIHIKRQKTGSDCHVRLLPIARQIIERYRSERKGDRIFNVKTLACMGYDFRQLETLCGIEHITFHMARHNFGTHITLSHGVPIETVSRMMGHGSITTTQIYAHMTSKRIEADMKELSHHESGKYAIFEDRLMPVGIYNTDNFRLTDNRINPNKTPRNYAKRNNRNQ